jgi:hypothetical protein
VLAVYGVRKYIANAKSAEATNALGILAQDASVAGNIQQAFCASASRAVPSSIASVRGTKYQSSRATLAAHQGHGFSASRSHSRVQRTRRSDSPCGSSCCASSSRSSARPHMPWA